MTNEPLCTQYFSHHLLWLVAPRANHYIVWQKMFPFRVIAALTCVLVGGSPPEISGFQISIATVTSFNFLSRVGVPETRRQWPSSSSSSNSMALFMARMQQRNRRPQTKEVKPVMNEEISAVELRVITTGSTGKDEALGIMSREDALLKAKQLGDLDLILINDKSDPPVCKIVDYSKYRYSQTKKAKEIRKNSKVSEVKEVKMSYKIDVHDYEVRKKNAYKFLRQGNRVKCTVVFRGREVQHDNLGFNLLDKLGADLTDTATREGKPKREGRNLAVIYSPRPEVMKAVSDERRAEERAKKMKKIEQLELRASSKAATADREGATDDTETDEDDGYDENDGDDDDDDDMEDSLDALLGGSDDVIKDLFK